MTRGSAQDGEVFQQPVKGQALEGYSAGGLPYGYMSSHDGTGYKRSILESEAKWIRYIFERYAIGDSPRQIASDLNALHVPSPRGSTWAHSALYPDAKGVGILGNPIYNGVQVWNRTEWLKDPVSNPRRRIMRPKAEWVITELPELKIVDDDLWKSCQDRAKTAKGDTASKKLDGKNSGGRGPKFLFSGLKNLAPPIIPHDVFPNLRSSSPNSILMTIGRPCGQT